MIASSGGCAPDTAQMTIVVLGGSGIFENQNMIFEVYPNPVIETLVIEGKLDNARLELTDASGRLVLKQNCNQKETQHTIDVGTLAPGMYSLKIYTQHYVVVKPVLIWK
jgi:hypothetical protein